MAGRHRAPRQYYDEPRGFRDGPPPPLARARPLSPRRLEDELSSRHAEMRRIREDNQRLADEIVGLRQTMPHLKEDLHASSQAIPKLRAEKELESRELTQRNLKLEAELRALEPLRQDALHLRSEAGKLQSLRQELAAKVQGLSKELDHQKSERQKIPAMIAERDALRHELIQTRAALEYEKKANPELTAQVQAMEKDLVAMAQEAEKLRADIAKRSAPSFSSHGTYGAPLSTPVMGLQGIYDGGYASIGSRYGTGPWGSHDPHGYPRQ
ncbi:protein FLX-like 3 [Phragmites australis]|uniref:protein FLX-like 3 n=1 Tax=Phragmites australis TaxID=29695 RepID=UPI002D76CD61|nr:protein FLX-like 3 [Phragmites australis]